MKDFTEQLNAVINPKVQKELGLKNIMAIPQLKKIVVNVGIGSRLKNTKDYSDVIENIASITGQKPIVTNAKKAISNFKLREGTPNGITTTLRRKKMLNFFNRMVNVAFPRIRDFQGFNAKGFDKHGNFSIGIKDCTIFPEVNPDDLSHIHGMSITIVTTAKDDESAKSLLSALNFPFKKVSEEKVASPHAKGERERPAEEGVPAKEERERSAEEEVPQESPEPQTKEESKGTQGFQKS